MTSPINISFDIETWGTQAGDDLRSIGACVFDPLNNVVGTDTPIGPHGEMYDLPTFYINCDNPLKFQGVYGVPFPDDYPQRDIDKIDGIHRKYNLKRNPDTVDWWYDKTSQEARDAFKDAVDLKVALQAFSTWLMSLGVDPKDENSCRIWSHGASFDPPIVDLAFAAVDLPLPWHYRAPRDTRTCFDDAGISNHSQFLKQFNFGVLHNALDDSLSQARGISYAKQRIDRWRRVYESTVDTLTGVTHDGVSK